MTTAIFQSACADLERFNGQRVEIVRPLSDWQDGSPAGNLYRCRLDGEAFTANLSELSDLQRELIP